jgi:hypothetical protein
MKKRGVDKDVFGFCGWDYLRLLVGVCGDSFDKALISGLFETGGRISEVLKLRFDNFHFGKFSDPRIVVVEMTVSKRRRPEMRVFPIRSDEPLAPYLLSYVKSVKGLLFPISRVTAFLTIRSVGERLARRGVHPDFSAIKSSQLYPHWFRAQRASQLRADYGFDEYDLKDFFHWRRSGEMPSIYSRLSWEQLALKMLSKEAF